MREEFLKKFVNSVICSIGASTLAIVIGSLAAYGLSRFDYKFGRWRNKDISFFFVSQLILPPVVLALPFLVLYKELALLDTQIGLILVYTLMVLPIVIWVMRDQFDTIPPEMEQAALVDGCSIWGAFLRIVLPIALPGMVAAFILSLVLCWNEYFFASLLTGFDAQTLPVMVASQTGSQGINWWTMAALCDRRDHAAPADRHLPRALHRDGPDGGLRQVAFAIHLRGDVTTTTTSGSSGRRSRSSRWSISGPAGLAAFRAPKSDSKASSKARGRDLAGAAGRRLRRGDVRQRERPSLRTQSRRRLGRDHGLCRSAASAAEIEDGRSGSIVLWDPIGEHSRVAAATGASVSCAKSSPAPMPPIWDCVDAGRRRGACDIASGSDRGDLALMYNISAEFAYSLDRRSIADRARSAVFSSIPDAILVSGAITGEAARMEDLEETKRALPGTPVLANTGVKHATVRDVLAVGRRLSSSDRL